MADKQVGALNVKINADTKGVQKGLKETQKGLSETQKGVKDLDGALNENSKNFDLWAAAAAAAAVAAAAALIKSQLDSLDKLAKTSDALGIQQERLQALQHSAELAGVSADGLSSNLERMQRNIGRAAREGGAAADAIEMLGLSIDEVASLPADKQMEVLAAAITDVENASIRASIASDLFGRDGAKMLKMLEGLKKDGLDPVVARLDELGASLSRDQTAAIEDANDAYYEMTVALNGFAQTLTVAVAPAIESVSKTITELLSYKDEIITAFQAVSAVIAGRYTAALIMGATEQAKLAAAQIATATTTKRVSNGIGGYTTITVAATTATKGLTLATNMLRGALAMLGGPIGAVITAVTALATFVDWQDETSTQTENTTKKINDQTAAATRLGAQVSKMKFSELQKSLQDTSTAILMVNDEIVKNEERLAGLNHALANVEEGSHAFTVLKEQAEIAEGQINGLKNRVKELQQQQQDIAYEIETGETPEETKAREDARLEALAQAAKDKADLQRQADENLIQAMQERLMTEEELLNHRHEQDMERLQEALTREHELTQEGKEMLEQLEQEHSDRIAQIRQQKAEREEEIERGKVNTMIALSEQLATSSLKLLGAFASQSFKTQKKFAIAESIVAIAGGVAKALNNPYPANLGFAAQVASQGAALISTIKSTEPNSGGSVPTTGGGSSAGGASTAGGQSQQPNQNVTISMTGGSLYTQDQVRELIGQINEAVGDGVQLNAMGA